MVAAAIPVLCRRQREAQTPGRGGTQPRAQSRSESRSGCIEYEQDELLNRVIRVFSQIYSLPLGAHDDRSFGLSTSIDPKAKAPRVFLAVLQRIYALGALAVRLKKWEVVRQLALQFPDRIDDYWTNWLRHGLTMASRSQQFTQRREDGSEVQLSLLTLAAQVIEHEAALHPDTDDVDSILTSLAQFDFLSNVAAIDGAGTRTGRSSTRTGLASDRSGFSRWPTASSATRPSARRSSVTTMTASSPVHLSR
jgi:hypothetical protein